MNHQLRMCFAALQDYFSVRVSAPHFGSQGLGLNPVEGEIFYELEQRFIAQGTGSSTSK